MSPKGRWDGLTLLVTGATSGIGRASVEQLAAEGAAVLVHGRSRERVAEVVARLRALHAQAEGLVADLGSLAETAGLARAARAATATLDVLVNNAGVGFGSDRWRRELSRDGYELRLAVNYLAPFLLVRELLASGPPPRAIVNVASIGQERIDLDDLMCTKGYDGQLAYRRSKLALVMATFDLAEELPAVASTALHPGTLLNTAMVRDAGIRPLGPVSRGVDSVLHVLGAALDGQVSGLYFDETRPARAHPQAYDRDARQALRGRTLELTQPFRTGA
jgi:NAD(P)-dependent dehydrogenase (short-subunit alcohol dehydrogenase family)